MEDIVHAMHGIAHGLNVTYIANVEFHLSEMVRISSLKLVTHIILLLLIAGENTNLPHIGGQEMLEDGIAEGSRSSRNH